MLADDPRVAACATRQLFRWTVGRDEDSADEPTLAVLADQYSTHKSLRELLVGLVTSPAITYRKGE